MALQAREKLEGMMATLNGTVGGRSLFAGTATDVSPLADSDVLLNGLRLALAGATTATDIDQAARNWFNDPAGFQALVYQGATQNVAAVQIGSGEQVTLSLRADDRVLKDIMRHAAVAALTSDVTLALDPDLRVEVQKASAEGLLTTQGALTGLRADLGFAQEAIEISQTRSAAARLSLEQIRNTLIEADPYTTASLFEEAEFQLESLYTVMSRMSRLSLVNFLR